MAIFDHPKKERPQLNIDDASKILDNVFKRTNVEPNSVPLEVLMAYSNYRKERFPVQRLILVIIMVLFCMVPVLFIPAKFTMQREDTETEYNPTYTLEVTSHMLVKRVTAVIGDRNVPVYEMGSHLYSLEPYTNGEMEVTVTLMNNQRTTKTIEVDRVDLETPTVVSTEADENCVWLYLSDNVAGVDYGRISAVMENGDVIFPLTIDQTAERVAFSYPDGTLNIFIPDHAGNQLQLLMNIR